MNNIDLCIWGPRNGFEVIYSENELWDSYLKNNQDLLDRKLQNLSKFSSEFIILNKNKENQIVSLIVPFVDSVRSTFMAISLITKHEVAYGSNLLFVLHKIWKIYEEGNFKDGRHLTTNAFDIDEMKSHIQSIEIINTNKFYYYSNCTIKYDDYSILRTELGKFKGDSIYFVENNLDSEVFGKLPSSILTLKEIISKGLTISEIDELKMLIRERKNIEKAVLLYNRSHIGLTENEKNDFHTWKTLIDFQISVNKIISEFNKYFQEISELEKGNQFIPTDLVNRIEKYGNQLPKDLLEKYKSWKNKYESTQKNVLFKQVELTIASLENEKEYSAFISKFNNVFNQANQSQKQELERLKEHISKKRYIELKDRIVKLYNKIYNVDKSTIKKNKEQLLRDVQALIYDVYELPDTYQGDQLLKSLEKFKYLESREWVPKDNSKLIRKLVIGCIVLVLTTGVFFIFKLFPHSKESEKVADSTAESGNSNTQEAAPREPENPAPTPPVQTPSGKTEIAYKNNKYRIAQEVLTDNGLKHKNGDYYRFLNQSKWELKRNGSTQWSTVEEKDINYFLSVNEKKIEKGNPPPQGEIALTGIALNKTSLNNLTVGGTAQLSVTFTPVNATNKTANWTSSNSSVASVSSAGKIKALKPGNATITVSSGSFTKTCEVTVVKAGGNEVIHNMSEVEKTELKNWYDIEKKKIKPQWKNLSDNDKIDKMKYLKTIITSIEGKEFLRKLEGANPK